MMLESKGEGVVRESGEGELVILAIQFPDHGAVMAVDVHKRAEVAAGNKVVAGIVFLGRVQVARKDQLCSINEHASYK